MFSCCPPMLGVTCPCWATQLGKSSQRCQLNPDGEWLPRGRDSSVRVLCAGVPLLQYMAEAAGVLLLLNDLKLLCGTRSEEACPPEADLGQCREGLQLEISWVLWKVFNARRSILQPEKNSQFLYMYTPTPPQAEREKERQRQTEQERQRQTETDRDRNIERG